MVRAPLGCQHPASESGLPKDGPTVTAADFRATYASGNDGDCESAAVLSSAKELACFDNYFSMYPDRRYA